MLFRKLHELRRLVVLKYSSSCSAFYNIAFHLCHFQRLRGRKSQLSPFEHCPYTCYLPEFYQTSFERHQIKFPTFSSLDQPYDSVNTLSSVRASEFRSTVSLQSLELKTYLCLCFCASLLATGFPVLVSANTEPFNCPLKCLPYNREYNWFCACARLQRDTPK